MATRLADPALALHRLYKYAGGFRPYRLPRCFKIAERNLIEAIDLWAEARNVLWLIAGGDHCQSSPMECALEGHDAKALGMAVVVMIFPRHLNRGFHGLGSGIGEKDHVCECRLRQPFGKAFLSRHAVEVGCVPQLLRLRRYGLDEMRVGVAETIDRNACREVEITLAGRRPKIGAFASFEFNIGPGICSKHRRHGAHSLFQLKKAAPAIGRLMLALLFSAS